MADTDYISVRRLRTFLAQMKQWVLGFAANRNTQAMSDVTKDTGISGTVAIGKSITIHTASGAQTANVMNADMIVDEKPTTNKDLASKAPTINLVDSMVMEAVSDAFDDITTIEYQSVNNVGKLPQAGQAGVIYLCSVWEEVENPTGNPHDLGYYVYTNGEYVLTADTTVQDETTYYTKAMATDEYIWLASESRYEPLGQAKVDLTGLLFAGSATSGGTAYKAAAIPFGRVDSTSTDTVFTASVEGITALEDGVCVLLQNGVVASASGFTININNLGAHPCFNNMTAATRDTTIFAKDYTMLMIYDATRVVGGITGAWCCYRGYDSNTNTIGYQLRTNSATLPAKFKTYRYRLYFTSADGTHWVGANASTSTNATSSRTPTSEKINPFGPIIYYSTNGTTNASANLTATTIWQQYTVTLGYSFNHTGEALVLEYPKPVYLKCVPQSDGSVKIAGSSTVASYVQELPTTEDGFVYIFLGIAYAATTMELRLEHPVYYFKDGAIRLWTNQAAAEVEIKKYNSDETDESEGTADYGQTDVVINGDVSTIVTTQAPPSAVRQYIAPSWRAMNQKLAEKADADAIPTKTSDLTNDSNFIAGQVGNGLSLKNGTLKVNQRDTLPTGGYDESLINIESDTTKDSYNIPAAILPWANTTRRGVVKVGDGLTTGSEATLKVDAGDGLAINTSTKELEVCTGDGLTINENDGSVEVDSSIISGASAGATAYQKPSGGIPKTDLASAVQTSLGKADTALQSHQDISGKVDYADGTKTTTTKQMGTTAVTIDGISMYTSESTTYTIQNGYTISIDAQGTSMGYIYQNSNSTILAQDPSGDVEWTNTTGASVVVKIGSATSGENYSVTIFKKGYYSTIEELTEKIEEAAASGVQADWNEDDSDDPAYIKNKPTVYTKPLSGIPKSDLANAVQTSLGKADSAVQDITITQSAAVGTGGTTIQVDNGNIYKVVSDGEPQGSDNGYVAPTWGVMKTLLSEKVADVELRHGDTYDLPYDAQVEYLQSSGTQYIDTGILATQDLECEIDCSINNGTSDVTILGARSGNTRMYLLHRASSAFCIGYGGYYTGGTFANNTRYLAKTILKPNIQTMDVDGTTIIQQNQSSNSTNINLYLFALNYSSKFYSNAKIWSCKIKQDGTLVRDFIPVRVGQVGYMYDKISGQLFGNEGTGDFTFGNDVEDDLEQTDLYVDDEKVGTLITSYAPSASARPYVAPSWQSLDERLSTKSDKSNTYTKSEVNNIWSGINNNVIIGELPSTGQLQNRIYRVPGTNSYTDWAWNGSSWVKLAEFSGSIFMQITEAEYDALSDSEKNNGTWYFIEEE